MNEWLQRWLILSSVWRASGLLGVALLLSALAWLTLLRPQQQIHARQAQQLVQMSQQIQQRQQQLAAGPAIAVLQSDITAMQQSVQGAPVTQTLESIIAARGRQLEAWYPENQPQHVQLRLNWQQFLPLFAELADTGLPVPQRFQLQGQQGTLGTHLWLENDDAA